MSISLLENRRKISFTISCIYTKKGLYIKKDNKDIFVKMRTKFDEMLDSQNFIFFKMSFNQIDHRNHCREVIN